LLSFAWVAVGSPLALADPGDTFVPLEETPSPPLEAEPAPATPAAPAKSVPPVTAPSPPEYLDYRLKLALADLSAIALVVGAIPAPEVAKAPMVYSGLGLYLVGGPTIHVLHAQPIRALASVGMRVGFPIVGALPGLALAAGCGDEICVLGGVFLGALGALVGAGAAIVVDGVALGRVPKYQVKADTQVDGGKRRLSAGPLIDPTRKTYGVSLRGSF
jgi:hypothetical protein